MTISGCGTGYSGHCKPIMVPFCFGYGEPVKIDIWRVRWLRCSGFSVRDLNNPGGQIEIVYSGSSLRKLLKNCFLMAKPQRQHISDLKANESRKSLDKFQDLHLTLDQPLTSKTTI